ncbi:MAG: TldD/PmbA family protein [SAR202 cluster bacterium]|nr:TldD/PmbA family protein [SAR202 cluster bacterium]|tara:strand:- start:11814 stop:13124 length:1311 start_codon:yes stop_codon:yes gene_type:complete
MDNIEKIEKYLVKNFDQHEIFEERSNQRSISFESNNLKEVSSNQSQGFAARAIKDNQITFSSSSNYDSESFISNFKELSNYPIPIDIRFPEQKDSKNTIIYDDEILSYKNEYLIETLKKNINKILLSFPNASCDAGFSLAEANSNLRNSSNLNINSHESFISFYISSQIINGNDMLNIYKYKNSVNTIKEKDINQMVSELCEELSIAQNIVDTPKKGCPVIFTPHGLYQTLLSPLLVSFSGTNLSKNLSSLCGKEGEKLFDEKIILSDDPHIDYSPASRNYDDEGVVTKKNILINKGIFNNGLYDLKTGSESSKDSTGSAGRSLHSNPSPTTSNIVMNEGKITINNIISDIDEGILVDHLLGAGQGNELSGNFSANISLGYKIEKGKIIGRVKNTMISGNAFDALKDIEEISLERDQVYGSMMLPYLQTKNVEISS